MLATHTSPGRKIHIMVVDDSAVTRALIVRHLGQQPNFDVVASLANGELAVNAIAHHRVDVVVLDIEMPVMDGLTALPKLLAAAPGVRVIMASTLTMRNAEISMRAMAMGASDYVPKPSMREDKESLERFYSELVSKINALGHARPVESIAPRIVPSLPASTVAPPPPASASTTLASKAAETISLIPPQNVSYPAVRPKALAIAASTGGPQALLEIFTALNGRLVDVPIFITQHMPRTFTQILAGHIAHACGRECREAEHGEPVQAGRIYIAPGDFHMVPKFDGAEAVITLNQDPEVNYCRPAADPMIEGLVRVYDKHLMLLVLTGMGHDGLAGARRLFDAGGAVIAQDRESCVVWGMPKAVSEHHLCRAVLPLQRIPGYLVQAFGGGAS